LPAIATSMIAATGSAVRATAQPQDQSQGPAGDSPFAILLAALSAQGMPAAEEIDGDALSDTTLSGSSPKDQVGQSGKAVAEKSNADDHAAQAALAALLNTTAAPPPFSPPAAGTSQIAASHPEMPATMMADKEKSKPAGENPSAGAPSDLASGNRQAASISDESSDPDIVDAPVPNTPVDPALVAVGDHPIAPVAAGDRSGPNIADASSDDAAPTGKAQNKHAAPDPSKADAAAAMVAAAYAIAGGPASTDPTANAAPTITPAIASLSADAAPEAGAKPSKNMSPPSPVTTAPDGDDAGPVAADTLLQNAGSVPVLPTIAARTTAAPIKSAGGKPANKDAAPGQPVSAAQDWPQMAAIAQTNVKAPSHAQKSDASAPPSSGDDTKPAQADAAPATVPTAAAIHAAPPSQPAAIFDPSIIVPPHPLPASASGSTPAASLEIANAASDPTPDLNGFAVSIAARSLSGAKQFEIRLDPPELGRVDVRLSIDATGKAVAHMATDQPQTLDLLRKDAPALTQALRDAGLDVSQNGLNFSLRGQDRQNSDSGGHGRRSNLSARLAIQAAQAPAALAYAGAVSNARLDIHV
jgi:flagellar hook-length control protein FliK